MIFFFVKLVNVKKYITFLSKVRSSRHVMLSKIATPLSAQRLCGKHLVTDSTGTSKGHHCAEDWTAAWKHARAREIRRIVVPSGYGTKSTSAHWIPFQKACKHLKHGHLHCGRSTYQVCRPFAHAQVLKRNLHTFGGSFVIHNWKYKYWVY